MHAWAEADALRAGVDEVTAADILWSMTSPELFHSFVVRLSWPPSRYGTWLGDALQRLLFK